MIKLFSYDDIYQSGIQIVKFGQTFDVDFDLDYISNWDVIRLKMNGSKHSIAVESSKKSVIMGAIVHIPEDSIEKIDTYKGKEYKRIPIKTMCGNDCQMYVKRTN